MSSKSEEIRKSFGEADAKRNAGLIIPEGIRYIRDIPYVINRVVPEGVPENPGVQTPWFHILDLCYPKGREEEKLPVIVSVHGGAYVYGTKEVYQFYAADLAGRGFAVVNFNYRLAPEHIFPAPLEDLAAVLDWISENQGRYPMDTNNVFLVGDSAGAQITSQYAVIYSNETYRDIMGFERPDVKIRAIGLCCGLYHMKEIAKTVSEDGVILDYLTENPWQFGEKLCDTDYVTAAYPPAYIFSAGGDFLMPKCKPMADFLREKGVECEYQIYGDESTGHVFHVDIRTELAKAANDDQTDFFKRHIHA